MGASWGEIEASNPEFAAKARAFFDAHRHKLLGTLRKDGSPRISGIETVFLDGWIYLGMMEGSHKALDLRRDPRLTLHSGSNEPDSWKGDARISGRGIEITDPAAIESFSKATAEEAGPESPEPFHLFRIEIDEAVTITLSDPPDHLIYEIWKPGQPLKRVERR